MTITQKWLNNTASNINLNNSQFGGYRLEVSYAHSLQVIPVMDGRRPLLAIRREPDSRSGNNMPFLAPVVSVRIPAIITTNYCSIQQPAQRTYADRVNPDVSVSCTILWLFGNEIHFLFRVYTRDISTIYYVQLHYFL